MWTPPTPRGCSGSKHNSSFWEKTGVGKKSPIPSPHCPGDRLAVLYPTCPLRAARRWDRTKPTHEQKLILNLQEAKKKLTSSQKTFHSEAIWGQENHLAVWCCDRHTVGHVTAADGLTESSPGAIQLLVSHSHPPPSTQPRRKFWGWLASWNTLCDPYHQDQRTSAASLRTCVCRLGKSMRKHYEARIWVSC